MLASNENNSIYLDRTPCGHMILLKVGRIGVWMTNDEFASLAGVIRRGFDSMMDGFLSEIDANRRMGRGEEK